MRKKLTKTLPAADVKEIERYISEELQRLKYHSDTTRKDHYTVYKHAFDQLVEDKTAIYKPILSNLKGEYEDCIEALEKGQSQSVYLQGMVKALLVEKSTLRQFIRRGDELEEKIQYLITHNQNLASKIQDLRDRRAERKASLESKSMQSLDKDTRMVIPGMSLEELTDLPTLRKTLQRLQIQASETEEACKTKLVVKSQKGVLKEKLAAKEVALHHVTEQHNKTKKRCEVLKVVMKALKDYGKIEDSTTAEQLHQLVNFDEDDPIKKKEAERLIEYCDHFNSLFDFGQFEAAAIHAANSPYGILRNYETLIRFKQVNAPVDENPLLMYCEALMATSSAAQPVSQAMSVEVVRCALEANHLDFATHWLAQGSLSYSIPLGDIIKKHCKCSGGRCTCTCLQLAQTIYMKINAHHRAAKCLCQQGRFVSLLQYTQRNGPFTKSDYQRLLIKKPSPELAHLMLTTKGTEKNSSILSFASVVSTLLDTGHRDVLIEVIKRLSSSSKKTKTDLSLVMNKVIFSETSQDNMSSEKWMDVVDICQGAGLMDAAVELLAALTIREALNKASIAFSMDYIS
ncbi:predicted protein [Nematostella vectensis]|uniref:Translin-associated factor X-interacting protein 1 N-terminal domain-containing protein n=1 Tax=Nematostella vectensis TaxID=45351 RepID=A7RYM9_NEMVE|nr:predicted protein [Nematostella vectensis]|eukprot:XP_001635552.1 predicted protein [Nematostella vectensis]